MNIECINNSTKKDIEINQLKNQLDVLKNEYENASSEYLKTLSEVSKSNIRLKKEIIERKKVEKELKKNEERLSNAQRIAHLGHWEWYIKKNNLVVSDEFNNILGTTQKKFKKTYEGLMLYVHPEDKELVDHAVNNSIQKHKPYDIDYRIIRLDGEERIVHAKGEVFYYKNGTAIKIAGTILDITERKKIEIELIDYQKQLRSLTEHIQNIREKERIDIAREIHDELGQTLTVLKFEIAWIKRNLPIKYKSIHNKIYSISEFVDNTIKNVKNIIYKLRPIMIDDFGLEETLIWYANEFQKKTNIKSNININLKNVKLNKIMSTTIYRIFQETLLNVASHSNANNVKIHIYIEKNKIIMVIEDDGIGITKKQINNPTSFGLLGIRERVLFLKGSIKINGIENKGTTIKAIIPIERRSISR